MHTTEAEIVKKLNAALTERGKEWPIRGKGFIQLEKALDDLYNHLDKNCTLLETIEHLSCLDNPVFIGGHMKSGTTLILNLLDSHPAVLAMPGDSHTRKFMKPAASYDLKKAERYWLARMVNPCGQPPYWFLEDVQKLAVFVSSMRSYAKAFPEKPLFSAVVYATLLGKYDEAERKSLKYWISKTPGDEHYINALLEVFPNARFLQVLRHPVTNFNSCIKLEKIRNRFPGSLSIIENITKSHTIAHANMSKLGPEKYHIVYYKFLVSETQATIDNVADFLKIDKCPGLYVPTVGGKPAAANSLASKEASKVKGRIHDYSLNTGKAWEKLTNNQKILMRIKAGPILAQNPYYEQDKAVVSGKLPYFILMVARIQQIMLRCWTKLKSVLSFKPKPWQPKL